ncbi:E3 ubiquitin ligase BIG BROTHER-related [Diplonema papillatum]|nr:E3 ubiquitin ligase BIG BROTHER-related [Diplonema papillatum]
MPPSPQDIEVVAATCELSADAAVLLLEKCDGSTAEAIDCYFAEEFSREDLEIEAARAGQKPVPACQYFWNGFCDKGSRCRLRHGSTADSSARRQAQPALFTRNTAEMNYEELLDLQDSMGKVRTSVDAAVRQQLKSIKPDEAHHGIRTCSICLEQLAADTPLTELPCAHPFHAACINQWMDASRACPVCKAEITVTAPQKLAPLWASHRAALRNRV